MKKLTLLFPLLLFGFIASAQFGILGGMATSALTNQQRAHMKKHLLVNLNMTYPVSIGNSLRGSKIVLPPTYLSVEYGLYDNITLGVMAGQMKTKNSGTIEGLAQDFIGGDIDFNNLNLQNIAQNILNGSSTTSDDYTVSNTSTLIGGTLKYNFVGGKNSILYLVNRTGFKIRNVRKDYGETGNELVDQVVDVAETSSGIFSSFSLGGNFFIDKKFKWAISPEIGWGPGWGDGLAISNNPVLLTIGVSYHRQPKKPAPKKLR